MTCKAGVRCLWCLFRRRPLRIDELESTIDALGAELESSTADQVEAMRTLSAFRRQYHDGTGALVNEVAKLRRAAERLKTALKDRGIGRED